MDAGFYDERVSGAGDDFEANDATITEGWHSTDVQLDSAVGEIHEEILRRQNLLGASYPFEIRENRVIYSQSQSLFYEFCLGICMADNITRGDNVFLPRTFERTCALLIQLFLGQDTGRIHTGAPRDATIGTTFQAAMTAVSNATAEWVWAPYPELAGTLSSSGDEGIDFVAWRNTPDGRKGKLFVVGQCACGDDWDTKFCDLNLGRIDKWFQPMSYANDPLRAFATPFHLSDTNLMAAQTEAGMVFDRARLVLLAEQYVNNAEYNAFLPRLRELFALATTVELARIA